jgi:hypothetical protein
LCFKRRARNFLWSRMIIMTNRSSEWPEALNFSLTSEDL